MMLIKLTFIALCGFFLTPSVSDSDFSDVGTGTVAASSSLTPLCSEGTRGEDFEVRFFAWAGSESIRFNAWGL